MRTGYDISPGEEMMRWMRDLFPIHRSLSGPGTLETLRYLKGLLPGLTLHKAESGTKAFDWTVPDEWTFREAWIEGPDGTRVVDVADHNLHVLGYSEPVDTVMDLEELDQHLYSLPERPDAIPFVTSYYKRRWGFCLPHSARTALKPGPYRVRIDADLKPGHLTYGELVLPGETEDEVLLSTYVCHPSMANNEVTGPAMAAALGRWLAGRDRRMTYRILFLVETIGSIIYLSRHLETMQARTKAGFVLTCLGDDRTWSFMPSRLGGTLADRVSTHVLDHAVGTYDRYTFLERGSDERQYCSPGVNLPVASIMRSKYATYPEYHTSDDNLDLVSADAMAQSFEVYRRVISAIEANRTYRNLVPCEPKLDARGLYPDLSTAESGLTVRAMMNVIAYADGEHDLLSIAEIIGEDVLVCAEIAEKLVAGGVLEAVED